MASVYGLSKSPLANVYKNAIKAANTYGKQSTLIFELNKMERISSESVVSESGVLSKSIKSTSKIITDNSAVFDGSRSRNLGLSGAGDRSSSQQISGNLELGSVEAGNNVWGARINLKVMEMEVEESDGDTNRKVNKIKTMPMQSMEQSVNQSKDYQILQNNLKSFTLTEQRQILLEQIKRLKQSEEQALLIEVVQLNSGKSFGELALIKNKPRAATIKCITDCHFAVMSKIDYQKVLQRIEQKNLNKIVEFLNQIPFLQSWTRSALSKLQYSLEQKTFKRSQIVYRENNDTADYIYMIRSGEFEIEKTLIQTKQKKIDISQVKVAETEEFSSRKDNVISRSKMRKDQEDSPRARNSSREGNVPQRSKVAVLMMNEDQKGITKKQTCKLACLGTG